MLIVGQMTKSNVGQWLDRQFLLWQTRDGARKTWGEFAEYLGVPRGTLDKWNRGERSPDADSVELLAVKCNDDSIYDLLGLTRPDPGLRQVIKDWPEVADEIRRQVVELIERAVVRNSIGESARRVWMSSSRH